MGLGVGKSGVGKASKELDNETNRKQRNYNFSMFTARLFKPNSMNDNYHSIYLLIYEIENRIMHRKRGNSILTK